MVLVREKEVPSGMTPTIALQLQSLAPAKTILISRSTMELLKQYAECDEANQYSITLDNKPLHPYFLVGEKKSEAHTSLEPGSSGLPMTGREDEFRDIQNI
jgi:hypothetical protein